jgi:hypothetical protein
MITVPPTAQVDKQLHAVPQLIVPVSNLEFGVQAGSTDTPVKHDPGQIDWLPSRPMHALINNAKTSARFVTLEFNQEKP